MLGRQDYLDLRLRLGLGLELRIGLGLEWYLGLEYGSLYLQSGGVRAEIFPGFDRLTVPRVNPSLCRLLTYVRLDHSLLNKIKNSSLISVSHALRVRSTQGN